MLGISKYIINFIITFSTINSCSGFNILISRKNFITNSLLYTQKDNLSSAYKVISSIVKPNMDDNINENFNEDSNKDLNEDLSEYLNESINKLYNNNRYSNNIYFTGSLNDKSCFQINEELLKHKKLILFEDDYADHINLYIQSPGGSLLPTLGLVDEIKNLEVPVHTYIRGYAASAATLLSVVGAKRYMYKHSLMMIHGVKLNEEGSIQTYLDVKDLNQNVDLFMSTIKDIYLTNSKLSEKKLDEMFLHDLWINSHDALKYELIDKIL